MGYINQNIKAAREHKKINQSEMADRVGKKRSTYATYEQDVQPSHEVMIKIADVLSIDVLDLYRENFITSLKDYKPKGKSTLSKEVNAQSHTVHATIRMEAMIRVLLRSTAELLAAQRKESVTKVLGELTRAVKDETSAEFEGL